MSRLLLISHSYSPRITPRALRWSAIAEHLSRQGYAIDVLCAWDPGMPRLEHRNGVEVHRVGSALLERVRSLLLGRPAFNIDGSRQETKSRAASRAGTHARKGRLSRVMKLTHDLTWKKVYWPDFAVLWYRAASKHAATLLSERQYDALVTIAPPFTGHLVGLSLKRGFPGIRWIADSGDPFCFAEFSTMNSEFLYKRLNRYAERRVFETADGLSVTTPETARIYSELFSMPQEGITVIPPVLNPEFLRIPNGRSQSRREGKIRLVYAGYFFPRLREPDSYLEAIDKAITFRPELEQRIELDFLGDAALVEKSLEKHPRIEKLCRLHGRCPRAMVLKAMDEADVLVNIGNATSFQLPSKVIEYASLGKCILNFSSQARDSSAEFLATYPLLMNVEGRCTERKAEDIADFLLLAPGRSMTRTQIDEFISPYTVERVADQYLSLIEGRIRHDAQSPRSSNQKDKRMPERTN